MEQKMNRKCTIAAVKMLLRRNEGIIVSETEIDSSLRISENYWKLVDKYKFLKI